MRACVWQALAVAFLLAGDAPAQQILTEGFEARGPFFKPGSADAVFKVEKHGADEETKHGGQRSEHIRLKVEKGKFVHYVYDLPPAPINEELSVSLWVKSNRPGVSVVCRAVLPRERDPDNPGRNLTLLLRCEPYLTTGWKAVILQDPRKKLREQQALAGLRLKRGVDTAGAYLDQIIVNCLDGTGTMDVWLDDLEAGPVMPAARSPRDVVGTPAVKPGPAAPPRRSSEAVLSGKRLLVDGKPFWMRLFRWNGIPAKIVNESNCNAVLLDESATDEQIADAVRNGLRLVPSLSPAPSTKALVERQARFPDVLGWSLGSNLDASQSTEMFSWAKRLQGGDTQRLLLADVWDGYRGYARSLDGGLIGTHRWPLFTSLELSRYREWLAQRRDLIQASYTWAWVQTHSPEWMMRLCHPEAGKAALKEPTGPTPEQVRLLAYASIAAGCRGLGFWSDRFLADAYQGRDRLLGLALLNQELKLLEKLLLEATGDPEWVET
ncbi:MAG: hypothetical protein K2W96_08670, partial [Gemmataceae bacterium]|nr:hypothetical protein [Gemmataceae bacterium]